MSVKSYAVPTGFRCFGREVVYSGDECRSINRTGVPAAMSPALFKAISSGQSSEEADDVLSSGSYRLNTALGGSQFQWLGEEFPAHGAVVDGHHQGREHARESLSFGRKFVSRMAEAARAKHLNIALHAGLDFRLLSNGTAAPLSDRGVSPLRMGVCEQGDTPSLSMLIAKLRSGSRSSEEDGVAAALAIQSMPLPKEGIEGTVNALLNYIVANRSAANRRVLGAVGAAVRKVLLNVPTEKMSVACEILNGDETTVVPIEVDLEVAKMIVRRVADDPDICATRFPELADSMLARAMSYSSRLLVNREMYNASAVHCVLATFLMQHHRSPELVGHLRKESVRWFRRLCGIRVTRLLESLKPGDDRCVGLRESLANVVREISE